jgi:P-type Ca2+ transporter type 2C
MMVPRQLPGTRPVHPSHDLADQPWLGLTEQEAARRLSSQGLNELPAARARSFWSVALGVLREPMLILLSCTGVVYLLLGDPMEAVALLMAIFVIIGITLYQESKTERALQALRDLSSPRALVIREGTRRRIPGREVVEGDLAVISEGDRVPADGIVLESRNLSVDESLLTGESVAVPKIAAMRAIEMGRPAGDNTPFVFSGTLVVRGHGIFEARSTGARTELGRIGTSLGRLPTESTRLQQETKALVRVFVVFGVACCVAVVLIFGYTRSDWLRGTLAGLTLAISLVPEEFPVVLTVFLALGAWRMSRQRVLTRRMPAIETLGAATVLCVDKTGTLTMNRMSVQMLFANDQWLRLEESTHEVPEIFHQIVEFSILASSRDPFDPMEKAFRDLGETLLQFTEHLHEDWRLAREYPLSSRLLAMSRAWDVPGARRRRIAAKGAPEAITELCRLPAPAKHKIESASAEMATQGLRVLAVAKAEALGDLPEDQRDLPFEFLGLIGLADPLRSAIPAAVKECYGAGIRVVMITGDYPVTARNIAAQAGFRNPEALITGAELDQLSENELARRIPSVEIFARVIPEQKLRIVGALKAAGEVVAMTGDGVNDAPALKAADIGIAMGNRGTDVAREAAALVLLDDDFSSIVNAIRHGRRIYDNLKKATAFILAVHVPIAGVTLIPLVLGWPLLLMPVHVVFLELIIDPACSIAFEAEPEESTVMARPPRNPNERLFGRKRVLMALLQGLTVLLTTLAIYRAFAYFGHDEPGSRAAGFSALVMGNLALIFTNRSGTRTIWETLASRNRALWVIVLGAFLTLLFALYAGPAKSIFHFSALHPMEVAIAVLAGFLGVLWFEMLKIATRPWRRRGAASGVEPW